MKGVLLGAAKIGVGIASILVLIIFFSVYILPVFATPTVTFITPTPANNENRSWDYVYINITSDEDLNQSFLEWGNSSGFTNVTMSNDSMVNWSVNMTSLAEYAYNYTVWAQNTSGNWNQSTRQYVTVDLNDPSVTLVSPVNNYNSTSANIDFIFNVTDTISSYLNCSIYVNGILNTYNSSTINGTDTTFQVTGLSEGNGQNWTVNCTDDSGRTDQPTVRIFNIDNVITITGNITWVNDGNVTNPISECAITQNAPGCSWFNASINFTADAGSGCLEPSWEGEGLPTFSVEINRSDCTYTVEFILNDPYATGPGNWSFKNSTLTLRGFNVSSDTDFLNIQLFPAGEYNTSVGGGAHPSGVIILGGIAVNYTNATIINATMEYARRGYLPEYVYQCQDWNFSEVNQWNGLCKNAANWSTTNNYLQNSTLNDTYINITFNSPSLADGLFIGEAAVNPRPKVSGSASISSISITKWGNQQNKYYSWVPIMQFNESGPFVATAGFVDDIMYYDVPFFKEPDYMEIFSYNFTVNLTFSADDNVSVVVSPSVKSDNNETKLSPAWAMTEEMLMPGNNTKNMTMLRPSFSQTGLELYYNYNGTDCGAYTEVNGSCDQYGTCTYRNATIFSSSNYICTENITYSWSTREMNISHVPGATGESYELSVLYAMAFNMETHKMYSPIYLVHQNFSGAFIPGPEQEAEGPPKPGESSNITFIISVNNSMTKFNRMESTDLLIHFLYPKNVTCHQCGPSNETFRANMTEAAYLYNSSNYTNESSWNLIAWVNETNPGGVNLTDAVNVSTDCHNITERFPDSPAYGKTLTICFIEFDFNLSSVNNWAPNSSSNVSLKMNATMNVSVSDEALMGTGAQGETTTYNASISTPQAGQVDMSDKVPNIELADSYQVCIDGQCFTDCGATEGNCTIGSLTVTFSKSGTHTVSVSYTRAAAAEAPTPPTGGDGLPPEKMPSVSHRFDKIEPGAAVSMSIDKEGLDFTQIQVEVKNRANDVSITVTKLAAQPASVVHNVTGKVYQYVEIERSENINDTNVQTASIKFRVNNTWISDNNIDKNSVTLNRYANNQWNKLTTTLVSEDANYTYYSAATPGFSVFVITGEVAAVAVCTPDAKQCVGDDLQQCKSDGSGWETLETCTYGCDSTNLVCNLAPGAVCTPGTKRCVGDNLEQCSSDGMQWTVSETCEYGCDSATLTCKSAPVTADYTWLYLAIIVVIIVIIIGVVGARKLRASSL